MEEYLEQVLHMPVSMETRPAGQLPLIYRNSVRLHELRMNGYVFLLIEPSGSMSLPELRKCYHRVSGLTGEQCALYLHSMTSYAGDVLLQEGIPFVWEGRRMYLPFLGLLLDAHEGRVLKPCERISFITQKLLLRSLYETWQGMTVSRAAEALQVSKMTATRCFDELEVLELPLLSVKSRARKLCADPDKPAMWELIRPFMRSPVIRTFRLAGPLPAGLPVSGMSALAAYSMLQEEPFPTVAFLKTQLKDLAVNTRRQVLPGEQPACIAHEVGYLLPFGDHGAIDPLSVVLMLTDEEKSDPRVEQSVNEMLEEYVW